MKTFSTKLGIGVLALSVLAGTLGAASVANAQEIDTCTVRSDVSADEANTLRGGKGITGNDLESGSTENGAVNEGSDLRVDDTADNPGSNALVCTFSLVKWITDILFLVILVVALLLLGYAAFLFVVSGTKDKKETARKTLLWAVVGLIVAGLARVIPAIVVNIIGS